MWLRWRSLLRATNRDGHKPESACADHSHDDHAATEPRAAVGPAEGGAGQRAHSTPRRHYRPPTSLNPMDSDLQRLANACNRAADYYGENPATPETVVDIYRAMAALASMLDNQAKVTPVMQRRLH